ncbi:MAG TPA: DNA primase [Patescibacteria group bacterium]|nr:DNA primase [Patescibacteria group bacterium]
MDATEDIKSRLAIEDVISEYVQLKRAGRNFKGLSPFGEEKTPSFIVSPEKQIWHDFSSGKGGNMFSFVMEMEGVDFREALELLARKAGIDLDQYKGRSQSNAKLKARLHEALEAAARFYQVQFSKNKTALTYVLNERQFTKDTALAFRLGYAPNTGVALKEFLTKKGFSEKELQQAGVLVKRYRGPSDMFRGRLMIPLQDPQGNVIGFTARLLEDEPDAPKYINTPQTLVYDKSRHVYGLHLAKDQIRRQGFAVLTEGNLDVIASHQAGITNVVATAGTALTEPHLKTIGRFASDIRLAFDADKAGIAATERAIPIASKANVSLSIINLPEAKDPDELIRKNPGLWEEATQEPQYALDWLIERYQAQLDLSTGQGKRHFSDILLPTIRSLQDAVEQDHYIQELARITGVRVEALDTKLANNQAPVRLRKKVSTNSVQNDQQQLEWAKAQDHLLALTLMRPTLRDQLELLDTEMLPQETGQQLLEYLQTHPEFDGDINHAPLLRQITDYVKIIALQYEALFNDLDEHEARYEANRLRIRLIDIFVKIKKAQLANALQDSDDAMSQKLLARVKALDALLKHSQENF